MESAGIQFNRGSKSAQPDGVFYCQKQRFKGKKARIQDPDREIDVFCHGVVEELTLVGKVVHIYLDSAKVNSIKVIGAEAISVHVLGECSMGHSEWRCSGSVSLCQSAPDSDDQLIIHQWNVISNILTVGVNTVCHEIDAMANMILLLGSFQVSKKGRMEARSSLMVSKDFTVNHATIMVAGELNHIGGFLRASQTKIHASNASMCDVDAVFDHCEINVNYQWFFSGKARFTNGKCWVGHATILGDFVAESNARVGFFSSQIKRSGSVSLESSCALLHDTAHHGDVIVDQGSQLALRGAYLSAPGSNMDMKSRLSAILNDGVFAGSLDMHDNPMHVYSNGVVDLVGDIKHVSVLEGSFGSLRKRSGALVNARVKRLLAKEDIVWEGQGDEFFDDRTFIRAGRLFRLTARHVVSRGFVQADVVSIRADQSVSLFGSYHAKHVEVSAGTDLHCYGEVHADSARFEGRDGDFSRSSIVITRDHLGIYFDRCLRREGSCASSVIDEAALWRYGFGGADYAEIMNAAFCFDFSVGARFYNQGYRTGFMDLGRWVVLPNLKRFNHVGIKQLLLNTSRMGISTMLGEFALPVLACESLYYLSFAFQDLPRHCEVLFDSNVRMRERIKAMSSIWIATRGAWQTGQSVYHWCRFSVQSRLMSHLTPDSAPTNDPDPVEVGHAKRIKLAAEALAEQEYQKALESGVAVQKPVNAENVVPESVPDVHVEEPPTFDYWEWTKGKIHDHHPTVLHLLALGLGARNYDAVISIGGVDIGINTMEANGLGGSFVKIAYNHNVLAGGYINAGLMFADQESLQTCRLYDVRWSHHHANRGAAWIGAYDQHGSLVWKNGVYEIDHHQGSGPIHLDDAFIVGNSSTTGLITVTGVGGIVGDYVRQTGLLNVVSKDGKPSTAIIHGSKQCEPLGHGDAQGQTLVLSGHLDNPMAHVTGQDGYDVTGGKRCVHVDQPLQLFQMKLPGTYDLEVKMPKGLIGQFWNPGHKVHVVTTQGDLIEMACVIASEFLADSARYIIKRTVVRICVDGDAHEHAAKGIYGVGVEHFAGGKFILSCDEGNVIIQGFEATGHDPVCGEVTYYFPFKLEGGRNGPVNGPATMILAPQGVVVLNHVQIKAWHDGENVIIAKAVYGLPKASPYTMGVSKGKTGLLGHEDYEERRQAMSEGHSAISGKTNTVIATDGKVGLVGTITEGETRLIATKGVIHVSTTGELKHQTTVNGLWGAGQEVSNVTEEVLVGMRHENGALILQTDEGSVVISDRIDTGDEALVMITKDPNGRLIIAKHVLTTTHEVSRQGFFIRIPWPTLDTLPLKEALMYLKAASDWLERLCGLLNVGVEGVNALDSLAKIYKAYSEGSLSNTIKEQLDISFGLLYEDTHQVVSAQKVSEGEVTCGAFYAKGPVLEYLNGANFSAAVSHMDVDCLRIQPAKLTMQSSKEGYSVELRIAPTDDPAAFAIKGLTLTNHQGATHEVCYQGGVIQPGILFLKDGSTIENNGGLLQPALVSGKNITLTFKTPQDTMAHRDQSRSISISFLENGGFASSFGGQGDTQDAQLSRCTASLVITGVDPEVLKELGQEFVFESSSKTQSAVFSNQAEGQQHWSDCNENTNNHDSHEGRAYRYQVTPSDIQRLDGHEAQGAPIASWPVGIAPTHYEADVRTVISGVTLVQQTGDPVVGSVEERHDVQVDTARVYRFVIPITNRKTMAASYRRMGEAAAHFGDRMGWTTTQLRADYMALLHNPDALKAFYKDDAELCAYLRSIDQLRNHLHGLSQAEQAVMIELIQGLVFEACDHINTQLYHDSVRTTLSNADLQEVGTAKIRALGDALEEKGVHIRHLDDGEIRVTIDLPHGSTRLSKWERGWAVFDGTLSAAAAMASGTMAFFTSETGVGAIYFGVEAFYFSDHAYKAFHEAWSGMPRETQFVQALEHFVSEQTAKYIDEGVGLVILGVAMTPYAKRFNRYIQRKYSQSSKRTLQASRSPTGLSLAAAEENSAYLQLQAQGILKHDGKLSKRVLGRAKLIVPGDELKERAVIRRLTKDGSSIRDWAKYKVKAKLQGYSSVVDHGRQWYPGQTVFVHFYHNRATGQIEHRVGFKIKQYVSAGFSHEGGKARELLLKHQLLLKWQRRRAARNALFKLGFAVNQSSFFSRPHRPRHTEGSDHRPAP